MVSGPIQAYSAGCWFTLQPLAMYGLLICWRVDLVLHLLEARTCPADTVRVGFPRELLCAGSQLQPWCKNPLEDRLLAGCDLKTASIIAAVQLVAVEVPLTALETMVPSTALHPSGDKGTLQHKN